MEEGVNMVRQSGKVTRATGAQIDEIEVISGGRHSTISLGHDEEGGITSIQVTNGNLPVSDLVQIIAQVRKINVTALTNIEKPIATMGSYPIFTWEKFLHDGLNLHWDAKEHPTLGGNKYGDIVVPADKHWIQDLYVAPWTGHLECPATLGASTWYSRSAFMYPHIVMNMRLPTITGFPNNPDNWFGFENGRDFRLGIAAFRWFFNAGAETMWVYVSKLGLGSFADITALLPANAKTVEHAYEVHVGKNLVEFLIDEQPIAVAALSPGIDQVRIDGPPYSLITSRCQIPACMTAILEIGPLGGQVLSCELSPMNVRISNGDAVYPRIYPLYVTASANRFVGQVIAAGSLSSHAFPLFGYDQKTLFFMANQAGSLLFEVITQGGNWRTYATIAIAASTLNIYNVTGQAIFARVTFTPSAFPCTILEAETILS